jgi:hypothetical protein
MALSDSVALAAHRWLCRYREYCHWAQLFFSCVLLNIGAFVRFPSLCSFWCRRHFYCRCSECVMTRTDTMIFPFFSICFAVELRTVLSLLSSRLPYRPTDALAAPSTPLDSTSPFFDRFHSDTAVPQPQGRAGRSGGGILTKNNIRPFPVLGSRSRQRQTC